MMSETEKKVRSLVHHYYNVCDINSAKTTLYCLGELLGVSIKTQAIQAASGLYNMSRGKDGYGLLNGAVMFMGILFSKKNMAEREISNICTRFADKFQEKFGSVINRDLGSSKEALRLKEEMTVNAILFDYDFLSEVECELTRKNPA